MDRGELLGESRRLCERGLLSAAADILSEYLRGHTEDAEAFRELAQVRIQQGRQDWAASLLKRAALIEETSPPALGRNGADEWDADDLAFVVAKAESHDALRSRHTLEGEEGDPVENAPEPQAARDASSSCRKQRILHLPPGVTPRRRGPGGGMALPRPGGICRLRPASSPEASPAPTAPESGFSPYPVRAGTAVDGDVPSDVSAERAPTAPPPARPTDAAPSETSAPRSPPARPSGPEAPEPKPTAQLSLDEDWTGPTSVPAMEPDTDLDELDDLWADEPEAEEPDAGSLDALSWLDELPDDDLEPSEEEEPLFDVDSGGTRLTDWDKVRRLTADALRNSGRTEDELQDVLQDIFQESPWPKTRISIEALLRTGLSADALSLTAEIRRIWRRHPEFAQCFYGAQYRGEAWMYTEQARSVLSWPAAARMAQAWSAYPCPEEIEHFLCEAWDHWRSDAELLRPFPDFQLYMGQRLGHLDGSLADWPEWTFEPDDAMQDPWLRLEDPDIWAALRPHLMRLGVRLAESDYRPPPRKKTVPASKIKSAEESEA